MKFYITQLKEEFQNDDVPILASAQAYYYLLAIVPLLILVFSILPYLNITSDEALQFIEQVAPGETAALLEENIISLIETPQGGLLTIGIIGTLWSASNGINAFIKATNIAYNVEESRSFLKVRLLSILLTLGMIVTLIVALVLPVFGEVIISAIDNAINLPGEILVVFNLLRWVISIFVMVGVLMALYRFAPNKNIPYAYIIPGALITAVLWQLISLAFSFYVSNFSNYSAVYGSLGGIIILMLWFFLTGLILMIGAEINVIYQRRQQKA
nr:YihY/virulence factor BrkB family protein [Thalassobacillus sp. CUG 92003]